MMVLMVAPVAAFTFFAKFNIALFAKLRVLTVCPSGLNVQRHLASAKSPLFSRPFSYKLRQI